MPWYILEFVCESDVGFVHMKHSVPVIVTNNCWIELYIA